MLVRAKDTMENLFRFSLFFVLRFCPLCSGPQECTGDVGFPHSSGAPEKAGVRLWILILSLFFADHRECKGDVPFPPSFGGWAWLGCH